MEITWKEITDGFAFQLSFSQGYSDLYHSLYHWCADQSINRESEAGRAFAHHLESAWEKRPLSGGLESSLLTSAAIHAAVLAEDDAAQDLRPFFATVGGEFRPERDQAALASALESLFLQEGEVLPWFLREAYVQTNEISRSVGWLIPAMIFQQRQSVHISLVELGCSAGLNLSADFQNWQWQLEGQNYSRGAAPWLMTQKLHLEDENDPPLHEILRAGNFPAIHQRIGFDRNPLNATQELDQLVLKACIWGDQPDRMQRFEAAVAGYQRMLDSGQKPRFYQGDIREAAKRLPALLQGDLPKPHILLVYNSAVTTYFSDAEYDDLRVNLMHSFQQLPEGVVGIWLENESARYNEIIEREKFFHLRARLSFMGGISSFYLAELEPHPQNVYFRPNWPPLLDMLGL